jgi:glycosyltransferase involved in cell wall biosynthesis
MKIFVIVAAYNVERTIGKVIDDLKKHNYNNIVVVNDGSKDNTEKIALQKKVIVLNHFMNRGQGAALATGNEYSLRQGADVIVHFDADRQMQVEDIPEMIKPILDRKADVTIGSRFLTKKSNIPFSKKIILFLGKLWLRLFFGVKLTDSQCGFRAMSRKAAQQIEIKQDRAEHASEILIEIFKKKIKYKEVPVTITYTEYSKKHTQHGKFHLLSGIKIALKTIIKRLFH